MKPLWDLCKARCRQRWLILFSLGCATRIYGEREWLDNEPAEEAGVLAGEIRARARVVVEKIRSIGSSQAGPDIAAAGVGAGLGYGAHRLIQTAGGYGKVAGIGRRKLARHSKAG